VQAVGGHLSLRRWLGTLLLSLAVSGCVRQAVLENDVQRAVLQDRVLQSQLDFETAEAALAAQLIEREALFVRNPQDERAQRLLAVGYEQLGQGFIEARRLEALANSDIAEVAHQAERQRQALARAKYYGYAGSSAAGFLAPLEPAKSACEKRDRGAYDQLLIAVLAAPAPEQAEQRLNYVLVQRLAKSWLLPEVAARCSFR
jgi:hypothetical protein